MVLAFSAQTTGQKKVEKSCLTVLRGYAMMGHMKRETATTKEATMKAATMKAVNVMVNGICEATIPMQHWGVLRDVMREWEGVNGVVLRPAKGKVFGNTRTCSRGFVRRDGRWWTL
jgi:hypothetical protein